MIDAAAWSVLTEKYPFLAELPPKVADIGRDELLPDEAVWSVASVTVRDAPTAIFLTQRRVLALWQTTMLFFFKLPTIQEFHLAQLTNVEHSGNQLRLRAVADPNDEDMGWEDSTFVFASEAEAQAFTAEVEARRI